MTLTITIEMENEAFSNGGRNGEVSRILRDLIEHIYWDDPNDHPLETGANNVLRDINGNTVGSVSVSE